LEAVQPKKRGRPKGSRNVPHLARPILTPPASDVKGDYKHADIDTIVSRQLSMLDWAQQALRNEMMRAYQAKGVSISIDDLEKLDRMSHAIMRGVDALKKSQDLAEEIAKKLSPEQLLDAAIAKIEAQDIKTLKWAIRRLRAYVEKLGPVSGAARMEMGEVTRPAAEAIASLGDE
jgi:hypothetical protein